MALPLLGVLPLNHHIPHHSILTSLQIDNQHQILPHRKSLLIRVIPRASSMNKNQISGNPKTNMALPLAGERLVHLLPNKINQIKPINIFGDGVIDHPPKGIQIVILNRKGMRVDHPGPLPRSGYLLPVERPFIWLIFDNLKNGDARFVDFIDIASYHELPFFVLEQFMVPPCRRHGTFVFGIAFGIDVVDLHRLVKYFG